MLSYVIMSDFVFMCHFFKFSLTCISTNGQHTRNDVESTLRDPLEASKGLNPPHFVLTGLRAGKRLREEMSGCVTPNPLVPSKDG